jgi:hypothetical protein
VCHASLLCKGREMRLLYPGPRLALPRVWQPVPLDSNIGVTRRQFLCHISLFLFTRAFSLHWWRENVCVRSEKYVRKVFATIYIRAKRCRVSE